MTTKESCVNNLNDNLALRDLYENYWHCRDFEIRNLWQRSIFLGTFIVLCFTGYGAFWGEAFFGEVDGLIVFDEKCVMNHFFAVLLTLLGLTFSQLWIFLAKASKAWVEIYERAICAIENKMKGCLGNYVGFNYDQLDEYAQNGFYRFDGSVDSCRGGYFSPSRINIMIGKIAMLVMFIASYFHLSVFFIWFSDDCLLFGFSRFGLTCCFLLSFVIVKIIQELIFFVMFLFTKSETLKNKDPKRLWIGNTTILVKLYKNEVDFLSVIRNELIEMLPIKVTFNYGCDEKNVYLICHFVYKKTQMKMDVYVVKNKLNKVFINIKNTLTGELVYKELIKGEKKCQPNDGMQLAKSLSRKRWLWLKFKHLGKNCLKKDDLDGLVSVVVKRLSEIDIVLKKVPV